jgi:hypothetical protein
MEFGATFEHLTTAILAGLNVANWGVGLKG